MPKTDLNTLDDWWNEGAEMTDKLSEIREICEEVQGMRTCAMAQRYSLQNDVIYRRMCEDAWDNISWLIAEVERLRSHIIAARCFHVLGDAKNMDRHLAEVLDDWEKDGFPAAKLGEESIEKWKRTND
jgi:hypothetical protein